MATYTRITSAKNATATRVQAAINAPEQALQLRVPSLHLIMGNNREGRRFKFGRQQIPDPDRNTNEVGAGYQQIQIFRRYSTGEFRAKSEHGKINAGQDPKTQRDPECGATPGQTQEAGKEQQGKKQARLNHSRSPVDDEYHRHTTWHYCPRAHRQRAEHPSQAANRLRIAAIASLTPSETGIHETNL